MATPGPIEHRVGGVFESHHPKRKNPPDARWSHPAGEVEEPTESRAVLLPAQGRRLRAASLIRPSDMRAAVEGSGGQHRDNKSSL
jgi:hypothetical protein